ncbi:hypothetical protein Tco_0673729, partial [Tanacetum coccineum]
MDKSKIARKQSKTSKHGHENQKSSKRSQRIKAEARKAKPQSNPVKDENYITKPSHWPIPIKEGHVAMEKAQWNVGFCAKTLTKEAQTSHQWNDTLAIFRCPQFDQTATIDAWMIEEMIG